jgi:hypothetical protein
MAKFVVKDPVVVLNGGTVSANVAQATIALEADDVETTNFAGNGWRERIGGLKAASISLDFHQDFGTGGIDSVIFPLLGGTASVDIIPTAGTSVSATNPRFSCTAAILEYSPLDSAVGDLATFSVTWPVTGEVTRGTSA